MGTGSAVARRPAARAWEAVGERRRRHAPASASVGWALLATSTLVFLTVPSAIVVVSSVSDTDYLTFPPRGFTWRWYRAFLESAEFTSALRTSLILAVAATAASLLIGGMAAFSLSRYRFRWRDQIVALFLSPLIVPMIVIGIALLQFFAQLGIARSFRLLLLGHLLITVPFVVRMVLSALAGFDRALEEAAMNLGASPPRAVLSITLPIITPGLVAAAIFAFIESFGNLTLSTFIAGPRDSTLPVRLFTYVEFAYDPTVTAVSTIILIITLGAMLLLARVASFERLF